MKLPAQDQHDGVGFPKLSVPHCFVGDVQNRKHENVSRFSLECLLVTFTDLHNVSDVGYTLKPYQEGQGA